MNFFAQQARARANTTRLVVLFALAVLCLIALTEFFIVLVICWTQGIPVLTIDGLMQAIDLMGGKLFWSIAAVITGIVLMAYLYKAIQLSGGGQTVAEAMNGRLINTNTRDPDEKKILNVVEEMAIASGTPVPPVYVIDDHAINAFAAGLTPHDAVIGITRGCIRVMNRDELQGIIAHEFSHIFNGDMRMNIRLVSVLHGILVIGLIGHFILRSLSNRRSSWGSTRSSKNGAGGILFLFVLGAGLYIIGYAGTFFGNLIKAAVSRQREFLADASAVQFTRNPEGIGGALKKIGGYAFGSRLQVESSDEFSHFFFSEGISKTFSGLMATHPPLDARIRCIDPQWRGKYPKVALPDEILANPNLVTPTTNGVAIDRVAMAAARASATAATADLVDTVGKPTAEDLNAAREWLDQLPDELATAAHEPYSARAILYCLLLDRQRDDIRTRQLAALEKKASADTFQLVIKLQSRIAALDVRHRLPLIDLCLPTLKQLSVTQSIAFREKMLLLIKADRVIDLFEWSLYRMVIHHLDRPAVITRHASLASLQDPIRLLVSAIALQSADTVEQAHSGFSAGWSELGLPASTLDTQALEDVGALDRALKKANHLHPLKKPRLIKACCAALPTEHRPESHELVRAISDGLDVPIPPRLANHSSH